jgi:hypothetical protein
MKLKIHQEKNIPNNAQTPNNVCTFFSFFLQDEHKPNFHVSQR